MKFCKTKKKFREKIESPKKKCQKTRVSSFPDRIEYPFKSTFFMESTSPPLKKRGCRKRNKEHVFSPQ